jgi:hypothetical protein
MREEQRWHENLEWLAGRAERRLLSDDGALFVKSLRDGFSAAARAARARSAGNHNVNPSVLGDALRTLVISRGLAVDVHAARILLGERPKSVDLSFSHRRRSWLVEIKFGLEFNSLAAAALEGRAFKRSDPSSRFLLLAAYSKFDGAKAPAQVAASILRDCGVKDAIDRIHVLSRRDLLGWRWAEHFVSSVNQLCRTLPGGARGS